MAFFPDKTFEDIGDYIDAYAALVQTALQSVDKGELARATERLEQAVLSGARIFVCGNGGSAAIANHFCCDHMKGISSDTGIMPNVLSLSTNIELITAIANDMSYDRIFAFQLSRQAERGDVLFVISSSGNSPNIVAAMEWAKENGVTVIAMSGFSGGAAKRGADISLHVAVDNYGVVEDAHQCLMHILAQYLRHKHLTAPEKLGAIKF